jgi:hypothetical protein
MHYLPDIQEARFRRLHWLFTCVFVGSCFRFVFALSVSCVI